ncbi:neuropeptide Y receptor type 5 isoform X2 [Myiozetetes cayanensis]|uniref:neuropeptide Y receptor type 5 isoform X2 n=1 Tax=Myiozetetes cayanensis TaxID=478635 RepID=UPI002160DC14|nr:neuropeptide Y receptor type 5 isoform X2 [Myiozetetes cayanensis]
METLIVTPCSAGIPGSRAAWSGLPKCASAVAPAPAPAPAPPGGRRVRQRRPRGAALGRRRDPAPPQRPPKAPPPPAPPCPPGWSRERGPGLPCPARLAPAAPRGSRSGTARRFIVQPSIG